MRPRRTRLRRSQVRYAAVVWVQDQARDDVRGYVTEALGDAETVLVAVYLAYAATAGHALVDRELYLSRGAGWPAAKAIVLISTVTNYGWRTTPEEVTSPSPAGGLDPPDIVAAATKVIPSRFGEAAAAAAP